MRCCRRLLASSIAALSPSRRPSTPIAPRHLPHTYHFHCPPPAFAAASISPHDGGGYRQPRLLDLWIPAHTHCRECHHRCCCRCFHCCCLPLLPISLWRAGRLFTGPLPYYSPAAVRRSPLAARPSPFAIQRAPPRGFRTHSVPLTTYRFESPSADR